MSGHRFSGWRGAEREALEDHRALLRGSVEGIKIERPSRLQLRRGALPKLSEEGIWIHYSSIIRASIALS